MNEKELEKLSGDPVPNRFLKEEHSSRYDFRYISLCETDWNLSKLRFSYTGFYIRNKWVLYQNR